MRLVDLSHVIGDGTVTYPGLPGPEITEHMSFDESRSHYEPGTEFSIGRISMVANTGTYLDTPAHRRRGGADLADLVIERCAMLPALVVDASGTRVIGPDLVRGYDVTGCAVLLRTGWDLHWGTEAYGAAEHPHLTADAAQCLVDGGAVLVGIDSVNIDATATGARPIHTLLLDADVLIVEHLTNLGSVPHRGARFTAAPVAVRGMASFPVRAFASVDRDEPVGDVRGAPPSPT
jgi:kynurenine formamidase